jgi:hypothetical protein
MASYAAKWWWFGKVVPCLWISPSFLLNSVIYSGLEYVIIDNWRYFPIVFSAFRTVFCFVLFCFARWLRFCVLCCHLVVSWLPRPRSHKAPSLQKWRLAVDSWAKNLFSTVGRASHSPSPAVGPPRRPHMWPGGDLGPNQDVRDTRPLPAIHTPPYPSGPLLLLLDLGHKPWNQWTQLPSSNGSWPCLLGQVNARSAPPGARSLLIPERSADTLVWLLASVFLSRPT